MSHAAILVALPPTPLSEVEAAVSFQMEPFDEQGEWLGEGTRWDWWVIGGRYDGRLARGNIIKVGDLNPELEMQKRIDLAYDEWKRFQKEDPKLREVFFGENPDIREEDFIRSRTLSWFPSHYAFLTNRHWHEQARLGWWGCEARTECEIRGENQIHRCKTKSKSDDEAYIVTWRDDEDSWNFKFYDRFIKPLSPDSVLVTVDYHV